jgi:hypothetical protein
MTTLSAERRELLADLRRQLPTLTDERARGRTERAIERLELELAPGRATEDAVQRRLDLGASR